MKKLYFKLLVKLLDFVTTHLGCFIYDEVSSEDFRKYKTAVKSLYDQIFDYDFIDEVYNNA